MTSYKKKEGTFPDVVYRILCRL